MPIHRVQGEQVDNRSTCKVTEYGEVGAADLAEAVINGRYPAQGFGVNNESDMKIYVVSGMGALMLHDKGYELHPGNVIQIDKLTPYCYEGVELRIIMVCSPAWNINQYDQVE